MNPTNTTELTTAARDGATDIVQNSAVLIALATSASTPDEIKGYHHVTVPYNYAHKDITEAVEKAQPVPNRKRGSIKLKDVASLLAYCKDQDAAATAYLYADTDRRLVTAIFNDQRANALPGWRDHRAEFLAEFTPEFDKWKSNNTKQMAQAEFAEFIEDNFADITEPAAHTMLEMATTIQAKTDINFSSAKRLQNGQVQLQYTEAIDARAGANGALEIPKEFSLGLRIFKNGEGYKLKARLKYRLHGGAIKFWYELDRPQRAIEEAFGDYVGILREQSGYQVLLGSP